MLARTTTTLSRRVARTVVARAATRSMSTEPQAPSSFSHEKMDADKRYQGASAVPESLLEAAPVDGEFSIQGQFREGRAAYLDMSATTPLDPRVLDAMAPYMVRYT